MSLRIAALEKGKPGKKSRAQLLGLVPKLVYDDGRTKQSFKDETDINKIMQRFSVTGTISHLAKWKGVYADFSDFDFMEQEQKLTRGAEIFAELPAEIRREFGQSAAAFFAYVNNPANADDLRKNLPALAEPGRQIPLTSPRNADTEAAVAAASEPASVDLQKTPAKPETTPPASS